jgi:hypothetical protein
VIITVLAQLLHGYSASINNIKTINLPYWIQHAEWLRLMYYICIYKLHEATWNIKVQVRYLIPSDVEG